MKLKINNVRISLRQEQTLELKATLSLRPDLLSAEQKELLTGRLPYKMKKSERRFYEELRAEIAAEQEKRASAEVKEDEANG